MDSLRKTATHEHSEVEFVMRPDIQKALEEPRTTLPYMTKYEYVALLAARARQLAEGAEALIPLKDFNMQDPRFVWNVAQKEILEGKVPLWVRRRLPGGKNEFWAVSELELAW